MKIMILQPVTVTTFDDIFFINAIKITITVLYIWSDEFMIMIIMYLVLSWFCLHKSSFHYINRLCNASSNCTLNGSCHNAMLNKISSHYWVITKLYQSYLLGIHDSKFDTIQGKIKEKSQILALPILIFIFKDFRLPKDKKDYSLQTLFTTECCYRMILFNWQQLNRCIII